MEFIHCNICHLRQKQEGGHFFLTNCGHIFCLKCAPRIQSPEVLCPKCRHRCTVLSLSSQLNQQVETFFKDPSQMCVDIQKQQEHLQKVLEFQASHRTSLFAYLEKENSKESKQMDRKMKALQEELQYWKQLFQSGVQSPNDRTHRIGQTDCPRTPRKSPYCLQGETQITPLKAPGDRTPGNGVTKDRTPGPARGPAGSPYVTSSVSAGNSPLAQSPMVGRRRLSQMISMEKLLNKKDKEVTELRSENKMLLDEKHQLVQDFSFEKQKILSELADLQLALSELNADKKILQEENGRLKTVEEDLTRLLKESNSKQLECQQAKVDIQKDNLNIRKTVTEKDDKMIKLQEKCLQLEQHIVDIQKNNQKEVLVATPRRPRPQEEYDSSPDLMELQLGDLDSVPLTNPNVKTPITRILIEPSKSSRKTPKLIRRTCTPARKRPQVKPQTARGQSDGELTVEEHINDNSYDIFSC